MESPKQRLESRERTLSSNPHSTNTTLASAKPHRRHSSLRPSSTVSTSPGMTLGDSAGTHSTTLKPKVKHSAKTDPPKARVRKLSSHETLFPTPEAAKAAFEQERAQNPLHRRAPTPYTSRATLRSKGSDRSIASRVSFDSTRSRGSARSRANSNASELSDYTIHPPADPSGRVELGPWDPGFGATRGIGPAGEAIEVIGLGRKTPRHRVFQRDMLKPALRASVGEPYPSPGGSHGGHRRDHGGGNAGAGVRSRRGHQEEGKPLPRRPTSIMGGVADVLRPTSRPLHARHASDFSSVTACSHADDPLERQRQGYHRARQSLPPPSAAGALGSRAGAPPGAFRQPQLSVLGSLFSSLLIDHPSTSERGHADNAGRAGETRHRQGGTGVRGMHRSLLPAESLYTYLALVHMPGWTDWPPSGPAGTMPKKSGWLGLGGMMGRRGFDTMGQEWHRRFALAEQGRMGRTMRAWEGSDKYWERRILEWCENNIPNESIPDNHRWGAQIFALPAEGFQTVEFYDEASMNSGDYGLLSFLTGSLFQTAVSALHMLRFSSTSFSFHLLPSPRPSTMGYAGHTPTGGEEQNALWEGFGTLALVNKDQPTDRAMIIQIRPPDVVDGNVLREFVKDRREWWHLAPELCVGDAGEANLLQAQVYDDCYQNQVYFFAVTNLKYWVFGHFDPTWSVAQVSPVLHRQMTEPSTMQCLVSWLVRSVDERPQAVEAILADRLVHSSPHQPLPPYSHPRVIHHPRRNDSVNSSATSFSSLITPVSPTPTDFSPWAGTGPVGQWQMGQMGQMGNCGLPNYWDIPRSPSTTSFAGYNTWSPASVNRPFSPPAYGTAGQMWYSGVGPYPWGMR